MDEKWKSLPKVELHCHLDGSVFPASLWAWAKELGLDDSSTLAEFRTRIQVPEQCPDLLSYLKRFDLPVACLQTADHLRQAAKELVQQAHEDGVIYLEARYAPVLHTKYLKKEENIEAVLAGLKEGEDEYGVKTGLLLCGLRAVDDEFSYRELPHLAHRYCTQGVVGIDLAGDEAGYPLHLPVFQDFFRLASHLNLPFTIHAGEAGATENVPLAIAYGARRLGHGLAAMKEARLIQLCANQHIHLELCPSSNLQTKAWPEEGTYPLPDLVRAGVACNINTDNRTVSNTTLTKEIAHLHRHFPEMDEAYFLKRQQEALDAAFLSAEEKQPLREQLSLFAKSPG